jgi:hypothetical protein
MKASVVEPSDPTERGRRSSQRVLVGTAQEFLPLPPALLAPEAERRQGAGRADQRIALT